MITEFDKVRKDAEEAREYKRTREALLAELEKVNTDDAAVGQVIMLTGVTEIDGIDYSMKKQYFIDEAMKFMSIEKQINTLSIPEAVRKNMRVLK